MKNEKQYCTCDCGNKHIISERQIPLLAEMVNSMVLVYQWAKQKGVTEFRRRDIKHLFNTETQTAHFGDLVYFGGIMYKEKRGFWGINFERCEAFMRGEKEVPVEVWKNPSTGEIRHGEYVTIRKVPNVVKYLDENEEYVALYRDPQQSIL